MEKDVVDVDDVDEEVEVGVDDDVVVGVLED